MTSHAELNKPEYYLNRELSILQFNLRVLEQALDHKHPLLERLTFLMIVSRNLDEFFEIRVAGIKEQIRLHAMTSGPDGLKPTQIWLEIGEQAHILVQRQYDILNTVLLPALEQEHIVFMRRHQWSEKQRHWIRNHFREQVLPILTPISLDPSHPFPQLVNKSLNFIVSLEGKDAFGRQIPFAVVPAPRALPRLIRLPDDICDPGDHYVFLSSMIHDNVSDLFPGMTPTGCYQFRLTRDADLALDEEDVEDLATALKGELSSRRFGNAVRLEVADNCPDILVEYLMRTCDIDAAALYRVHGPVNLARLFLSLNRPELRYEPLLPCLSERLQHVDNYFSLISQGDVLLHHPFESFTPVIELLRHAARDPQVLAIKQTLYRTGADSEIVRLLAEAARNGKEVTAIIELRARFDEESNIEVARLLQEAGAIVVYGIVGYKTHAKMILIVRREDNKLHRYVHLGTGNYHAGNAKLYTDYSLMTADADLCEDVHKIFQQLTGMGRAAKLKKLLHSPFTLHRQLLSAIEDERKQALAGNESHILCKMNALTEPQLMQALYSASQAGVKIELIVRGICCLRPGIPGISENITVHSIVGRFLEHSRVFWFHNNGSPRLYCASADWMERNLFSRVETCFPVEDPELVKRVFNEGLKVYLQDNCQSWALQSDGSYIRQHPGKAHSFSAQHYLFDKLSAR